MEWSSSFQILSTHFETNDIHGRQFLFLLFNEPLPPNKKFIPGTFLRNLIQGENRQSFDRRKADRKEGEKSS